MFCNYPEWRITAWRTYTHTLCLWNGYVVVVDVLQMFTLAHMYDSDCVHTQWVSMAMVNMRFHSHPEMDDYRVASKRYVKIGQNAINTL